MKIRKLLGQKYLTQAKGEEKVAAEGTCSEGSAMPGHRLGAGQAQRRTSPS